MSRIGRNPIPVPKGVTVTINETQISVKGKLGELHQAIPDGISVAKEGDTLYVRRRDDSQSQRALHGLSRALIANMVKGVNEGYTKDLEIVGVGYRAEQRGKSLILAMGFSHRIAFIPPDGITIKVNNPNTLSVSGIDKQLIGEVAAKIRAVRPPEPYKGKGIKYVGEVVRRKAGKTAGK